MRRCIKFVCGNCMIGQPHLDYVTWVTIGARKVLLIRK
jgi:hypothetical protein